MPAKQTLSGKLTIEKCCRWPSVYPMPCGLPISIIHWN